MLLQMHTTASRLSLRLRDIHRSEGGAGADQGGEGQGLRDQCLRSGCRKEKNENTEMEEIMKKDFLNALYILLTGLLLVVLATMRARADEPKQIINGEYVIAEIHTQDNAIDITEPPTHSNTFNTLEALDALNDGFRYIAECPLTEEQQRTVYHWWTEVGGLDYATGLALADKETGGTFNVAALNKHSHDYGLFQINRASWFRHMKEALGISSLDDLREDLALCTQAAVIVYGDCINMYGDTERAIVAYNKGPTSTRSNKYSRDVLSRKAKWQAAWENAV